MRQASIAARNAAVGTVAQAANIGITLVLTPMIIGMVGKAAYGVFLLAMSFIEVLELLRSVVGQTCTYTVASKRETGDLEAINRTVSAAMLVAVVQGALGFVVLAAAGEPMYRLFDIPAELHWQTLAVFAIAALTTLGCFPLYPFQGVMWGFQRHDIVYAIVAVFQVLRVVAILAILKWVVSDVTVVMAVTAAALVLTQAMIALWSRRVLPSLSVSLRQVRRADFAPLLSFGTFLLLTQIAATLDMQGGKWVVGKLLGVEHLTHLWVATMVVILAYNFVAQVTAVLMPIASRYKALGDHGKLQETFVQGCRLSFMMAGAVLCGLLPQMDLFLSLWMKGQDFAWLAPYAQVLGAVTVVTASSSCAYQMLQGLGNARLTFYGMTAAMVAGFGTMLLAAGWLEMGFWGIVLGLCVGQFCRWVILTALAQGLVRAPLGALAWRAYAQPLAGLAAGAGVVIAGRWWLQPAGWPGFGLLLAAGAIAYCLAMLPLLNTVERQVIGSALQKVGAVVFRNRYRG